MSDTPIDWGLTSKESTRYPGFLTDRIEAFRDEYNEEMAGALGDDADAFQLEYPSEARRRLIDIGLRHYEEHGLPFGFPFDPAEFTDVPDVDVRCPRCGETNPGEFRVGASKTNSGVEFRTTKCLACGDTSTIDVVVQEGPARLF